MGWVRVGSTSVKKAYNQGKAPQNRGAQREMTELEEKAGPIVMAIFLGVAAILFIIALIFS